MAVFSRFWPFLVQFFIVTHIYGQTMYILQKNCPQTSFPGGKEAPNILHSGKMLAPHFKDEIASLQKLPFLAGFWPFFGAVFFIMTHIYRQTKYILQKNCPQMSFPGCRKAPKILLPLLKGSHRLLNWQIQITRVSWIGQSTNDDDDDDDQDDDDAHLGNFLRSSISSLLLATSGWLQPRPFLSNPR